MRKETLVFLTSLAIIFIIGYVNMTMAPKNTFDEEDYAEFEEELGNDAEKEDMAQIVENDSKNTGNADTDEFVEQTDKTDIKSDNSTSDVSATEDETETADAETQDDEDYVILGDITDILDKKPEEDESGNKTENKDESVTASSDSAGIIDKLNSSFANFKLNKEKDNSDIIDHLEESISNESISTETKDQFEALLLNKNESLEKEKGIETMLKSKGYNETVAIVDKDVIKVVTNDSIEQADATKILDVIVSETSYEPAQIKIVKFDNIDL
jgi:stage III sporulation protein AH